MLQTRGILALCIGKNLDEIPFDATNKFCLDRLASRLGIRSPIRSARQIHGDVIALDEDTEACDAFLVRSGQAALIRHADCFPVVVASPGSSLAIVAHCGWRGALQGLAVKSVKQLVSMGCDLSGLVAAIGPGIGPDSFEVSKDVLRQFPSEFHSRTTRGTPSVDLPSLLNRQLMDSGLSLRNICLSPVDTFTDPKFHSYRREGELSGRNATICIVQHTANPHPETQP